MVQVGVGVVVGQGAAMMGARVVEGWVAVVGREAEDRGVAVDSLVGAKEDARLVARKGNHSVRLRAELPLQGESRS